MKSSQALCEEMGINNIEINYTQEDFQNLVTYKLFNQHIRPILLEKNPKLVMYKMVSVIGAKWREFIELREQSEAKNKTETTSEDDKTESKTETLASLAASSSTTPVEEEPTSSKRRAGRKRGYDYEADEATTNNDASIAADLEEESYSTRRTSSRNKKSNGKSKQNDEDSNGKESNKKSDKSSDKTAAKSAKKRKRREGDEGGGGGGYNDSDAEFEAMLEEQCRIEENEQAKKKQKQQARKVAAAEAAAAAAVSNTARIVNSKTMGANRVKTQVSTNKSKMKNTTDHDEFETDHHQDFCDVCQAGGEIILCDTCPKAYHLVCLEPELEEAPEGEWFCPTCEKDGVAANKKAQNAEALAKAAVDSDGIQHFEYCSWCKDGGELICCETCAQSYHIDCLNPPLSKIPNSEWYCPRCSCPKLKGVIKKILTWRWKPDVEDTKKALKEEATVDTKKKKKPMLKIKLKKPVTKKKKESDDEDGDDENDEDNESKTQSEDEEEEEEEEEKS